MTASPNSVDHPLAGGNPPPWASAWGEDVYGPWAQFRVEDARQRVRWIPPSTFQMGSPEGESGHYDDEGPQHAVSITRGYWLFDTPCTQALWEAVMGADANPSHFQHPDRPVESVDWRQCLEFCERLGSMLGASWTLPTEAQWELACRAGTDTATYVGDLEILGRENAPLLDEIAWYGGNSGVSVDIEGVGVAEWREKQYEFPDAASRIVGQKRPNPWGLYDMLGNVWEWCLDDMQEYKASNAPVRDPCGPTGASGSRVIRGGGWYSNARDVRAAYRFALVPSNRDYNLGFRCCSSSGAPRS